MKAWIEVIWERIRSSFWFVPGIMCVGALLLSIGTISLDDEVAEKIDLPWLYRGGAEGARGVLTSISQSMLAVVSTVFSITIVALSLTSTQYGPRLLRTFMRDRTVHLSLERLTNLRSRFVKRSGCRLDGGNRGPNADWPS